MGPSLTAAPSALALITAPPCSTDKPGQEVRFNFSKKELPVRPRAGSSPIRNAPQIMLTSPSVSKIRQRRLRGGSHGDVDFKSVINSASDWEMIPGADEQLLSSGIMKEIGIHHDIVSKLRSSPNSSLPHEDGFDSGDESDASSTMSSDFMATADSNPAVIGHAISPIQRSIMRASPGIFDILPPPIRPVSVVHPVSMLSMLLKAKSGEAESPMDPYRLFSGKGEIAPIYLKIYMPSVGAQPFEITLCKLAKEEIGGNTRSRETTVAEAIGFVLYKYTEEKKTPALKEEQLDINRWVFRMVDEGEPDDDFPPLERTQPITAYITKKAPRINRLAAGANREVKMEGEFALCEATEEQCEF